MTFLELAEKQLLRCTVCCCLNHSRHPIQSSGAGGASRSWFLSTLHMVQVEQVGASGSLVFNEYCDFLYFIDSVFKIQENAG